MKKEAMVNHDQGNSRFIVVYETLKKKIMEGELPSNTPLVEEKLAKEFQMSRTPIREAIRHLVQDGLVEFFPRRGALVKEITVKDLEDIFTVREALEGISARIAASVITEQKIILLHEALKKADQELENGDKDQSFELGNTLHEIVLDVANNNKILTIVSDFKNQIQRFHYFSYHIPGRLELSNKEHWEIFEAIQAGDGELAERRMRKHVRGTKESILFAVKNNIRTI
ncbi:GntR family transcriptional regulator [Paenibacillus validus]|uniref:GntR family transcriptional regulator n=1 Tax=Paenibacillus TaxID=44249 RepID=UPI0013E0C308|nr:MULTISPECIES: GntR family transcriptional regulator [Paenibacillus]MED4601038.1 GntR family transcriptional regulator [Paenibacillus validus]MED4604915.1 GntR family transcriptional regulator [Paenibacillus validus]